MIRLIFKKKDLSYCAMPLNVSPILKRYNIVWDIQGSSSTLAFRQVQKSQVKTKCLSLCDLLPQLWGYNFDEIGFCLASSKREKKLAIMNKYTFLQNWLFAFFCSGDILDESFHFYAFSLYSSPLTKGGSSFSAYS